MTSREFRAKCMQVILLGLAGFSVAILVHGQTITEDEVRWGARPYAPRTENAIRVQTNMVEVGVVVRDSHGKTVGGLTQADFEVLDNGKPQKTTFFSVENAPPPLAAAPAAPSSADNPAPPPAPVAKPKPRYIAFYFDDFSMPEGDLAFSRRAAEQFVRESLEPGDRIGVFTSSTMVFLDFTADRAKLLTALGQLVTHQRRADRGPCRALASALISLGKSFKTTMFIRTPSMKPWQRLCSAADALPVAVVVEQLSADARHRQDTSARNCRPRRAILTEHPWNPQRRYQASGKIFRPPDARSYLIRFFHPNCSTETGQADK